MSVSKEESKDLDEVPDEPGILNLIFSVIKKASVVGIVYLAGYMQWSIGWFVGPIILFVIRDQWKKRSDYKRNTAKIVAQTSEKNVVLARLGDLPAWVFFPDIERAEWLNRIIKQVWPNVNHYTRNLIRDTIQPILRTTLEKYKLKGFKFERIVLGNVPFRIGGVKVYDKNIARNEIIMDIDLFYAGDCDITFILAGIKGGIRDFQLHGMLRVVLKPLISTIPLFGGIQTFFLNNPEIDFNLIGVADLLDMPGLSDVLRKIITETIGSIMVLPNKLSIKLNDEIEAIELKGPQPEGVLRVHLVEAKNLMRKDIGVLGKGKSDPYGVLNVGSQEFRSKVIDNTLDPKWDFWCEFNVLDSKGQQLYIHLWDKDDTSDDEKLGRAALDISDIVDKGQDDMWINLEQAKHGMVHLRLIWLSLSNDINDLKPALEEVKLLQITTLNTALLTIFIDSAKNLPQARTSSRPDPFVVLKTGTHKAQTQIMMRTIDPVWEEGFTFLISNPDSDYLYINVMDQKTGNELGHITYRISNLLGRINLELSHEPFSLAKSGAESKIVLSMQLRILKKVIPETAVQNDDANLKKTEDTIDEGFKDETIPLISSTMVQSQQSEVQEDLVQTKEILQDSTVPSDDDLTKSLLHRTPSMTSSAGEAGLGRIQLTLRYSVARQILVVVVHKIANIPLKDPSNIPDPYVKLYLLPERSKESKKKTRVIKDNCNPIYDETFEYVISQGELNNKQLEITVGTQKQLFYSSSKCLGQVIIDFGKLNLTHAYNSWFDLQPEINRD